ncbi:hypothetical protein SETIT_3G039400v2 [Setaria italica]|uniref:Kri1-like C-terminal domain-containing protein n=1 Tax=Setaria italica TaxID=4555 RepID=A0A368QBF2_SETIT|nr:hypothetical protein SETIT_3G039400v2 [Setaria italica]
MRKTKEEKRTLGILAGSGDDSDGPDEDPSSIQINEDYARRDEAPQQRLEKRREEGLQLPASEESSDVEEEDEESSEEDDAIIASRRAEEEELKQEKRKVNKEKPLYLKDVNARHLLDEGTEATAQTGRSSKYDRIAYHGQQKKGLEAFLQAQKEVLGDGDDDDLFQVKPKVGAGDDDHHEEEEEDEKHTMELAGEVFGDDEELDENEKFLKEFFLKRPYLESGKEGKSYLNDIHELSEEKELEKQEQYEHAHNYRHDEAVASGAVVADRVTGHSRVVEGSARKKESSRKQQRKSKGERAAQAKQEQVEELKHLKNLKKKEIAEKLERIRMIAGHDACRLCRKMQEMFGDSYYEADDVDPEFGSGEEMDLEKADSGKEDNFLELPKGWSWTTGQSKDDQSTATDGEATKGRISLKDKVELGKEMKEYYKLDHEDTIGDLKTRFKYKKVNPNSFGLSACEILASDDKDLNQYVPMKKLAPYRESE